MDPATQWEIASIERSWSAYQAEMDDTDDAEDSSEPPATAIAAGVVAVAAVVAVVAGVAWRSRRSSRPRKVSVYEDIDAGLAPVLHSIRRANPIYGESMEYKADAVAV